ncbi:protein KRI1 homolog [Chelonus insularis]|uniref:protein KRI1 homolog n=1 Tax=Chelonus insularis TaxID=460826 RepID=UPI00158BE5DC|nr:protein KRI1 homolog [Chelonus insularis]
MSKLFDDGGCDDNEEELKVNSSYANNYNKWRQKEELNKLKTKYGDHLKDLDSSEGSSESSSSEDEDGKELTEEFEKDFFKTLSFLKKKDPKIYESDVVFFPSTQNDKDATDNEDESSKSNKNDKKKKEKKEKPLSIRDYERKMILEHDGLFSDSENELDISKKSDEKKKKPLTYVEEQRELQESIKQALKDDDDNDDGFLKVKNKSEEEKIKEEESYKQWLAGQTEKIDDEDKDQLKYLRDFWSDPNLNENEKFLRDYVLNKKFLEKENDAEEELNEDYHHRLHDSDENLSEDEKNLNEQEEFEHKYNFRFEEPDAEFIKRYPRTMENSLRKKDTRRAQKRAEVKKRKEEEKIRMKEELKQLKALKRKEIMDKIAQLKEITGNDDLNLDSIDFDSDFDPNEHDKKMQQIFNEEYYNNGEDNVKPEFPELDQELEIERDWDNVDPNAVKNAENYDYDDNQPHCEDPDFNMDADYDPNNKSNLEQELVDNSRKKRKRKSKFAKLIATEKPKFDPKLHSSFMEYFDQYYALDYEDMIGDIPCRFKYRKVVPNDYGLTTEEILLADDKELNKWCSLKKALEHKPENVEFREIQIYKQKAKNEAYKKKILSSLYKNNDDEDQNDDQNQQETNETVNKKKRKKNKKKVDEQDIKMEDSSQPEIKVENTSEDVVVNNKNDRKRKIEDANENGESKEKVPKEDEAETPLIDVTKIQPIVNIPKELKKDKQKIKNENVQAKNGKSNSPPSKKSKMAKNKNEKVSAKNKQKHKKSNSTNIAQKQEDLITSMSNKRLEAYGLNPKKFKNKLKYGKQKF